MSQYSQGNAAALPQIKPTERTTILAVDDDRISMTILEQALETFGYTVVTARSGAEALSILDERGVAIDAVILDREMPGLSGMDVLARMKASPSLSSIPIIMLTGSGAASQIQEGIDAGVYYYLVKPANGPLLKSVIGAALRESHQLQELSYELTRHDIAARAIQNCRITVRTLEEAQDTARLLATCFPNPERVVVGLMELITNAVEHGNLGVGFEEKGRLIDSGQWKQEVNRRLALPNFKDMSVDVIYQHKEEGWLVQITDQGAGFDWRKFWNIDPARATANHGRGIARARIGAFDRLAYNEAGNQVTAMVEAKAADADLEW